MTNKTPFIVQAKENNAFSFSPTFKFNSFFYSSLRRVHLYSTTPWKDHYGASIISFFKTNNPVEFKSKRLDPLFPIHYKSIFHKILNKGIIYEKDMNKENFDGFIENQNFNFGFSFNHSLNVKPQIQILKMINRCYSWHLEGQPQSESFKKNICDELDALLTNSENHKLYSSRAVDSGDNGNVYFTETINRFLNCISEIGEYSSVSDLQKLTIELMIDINLAFIKLLEDKHGIIKPNYPLQSREWLNWEELSQYFKPLSSYEDKTGKYFKVTDVAHSLNCFIHDYMVEQVKNRELAGRYYNYSLGRMVYWHKFKYDQATPQDMDQLKPHEGHEGNDLFNIYSCYWSELVELKKLNPKEDCYPYFYDAVSANYIRMVRPDFENKLNQMAQLLGWESRREDIIERLQNRINDAKETIKNQ